MPTGARLDATFAIRTEHSGDIEPVLTRLGRFTDLVVVDPPVRRGRSRHVLDTTLFSVGRPTRTIGSP
ncbi:hypothetical protein [Methylobacterium goesingense]|uniref:Uncharacterized protein n=1 Tax=Methylobacterium goesingense TaxID=243690 RepID=A0ABV2L1V3_9HYPH|nr:hypothetical protein [Methylobacterium goesingense]